MKVLSDIYTYSKDKSSSVFNSNSLNESKKSKKKLEEGSWFSKTWKSTPSSSKGSWFNKISLPKYEIPKLSFPKISYPNISIPTISLPNISLPNISLPKYSFPKFTLPTVWFKIFLIKLEETRVNCYLYLVELLRIVKQKSCCCLRVSYIKLSNLNCSYLKCSCLQFNSNPEYVKFPWYKRAYYSVRDNVNVYINNITKNNFVNIKENSDYEIEKEEHNFNKKGSKSKIDEERTTSREFNEEDKYGMKHSQSSKYSNDLNTLRSTKKLKKTNTDDIKNNKDTSSFTIKNTKVFSMFSKTDLDNKSYNTVNSPINKSGSLYIDANEEKTIDENININTSENIIKNINENRNENTNVIDVTNEETIPESNDTTTGSAKFNIKKTWDKFSKIIS